MSHKDSLVLDDVQLLVEAGDDCFVPLETPTSTTGTGTAFLVERRRHLRRLLESPSACVCACVRVCVCACVSAVYHPFTLDRFL